MNCFKNMHAASSDVSADEWQLIKLIKLCRLHSVLNSYAKSSNIMEDQRALPHRTVDVSRVKVQFERGQLTRKWLQRRQAVQKKTKTLSNE